jgi:hypothetical protein
MVETTNAHSFRGFHLEYCKGCGSTTLKLILTKLLEARLLEGT